MNLTGPWTVFLKRYYNSSLTVDQDFTYTIYDENFLLNTDIGDSTFIVPYMTIQTSEFYYLQFWSNDNSFFYAEALNHDIRSDPFTIYGRKF